MRKIAKMTRLTVKPYPVIRFDNEECTENLIFPVSSRGLQFSRTAVSKHAQILKLSAAQANSVCLATNQIDL